MNKPAKESPTVLVVEADPEIRFYLRRCLGSLPAPVPRVHEAENVDQAISLLQDGGIDLVIGVLNGRGLGGSALCTALGVGDRGQVPVLLLATGVSSVSEVRGVRSLASTTVLPDSPSASRLCSTVQRILTERSKERKERNAEHKSSRAYPVTPPVARRPTKGREEK